MHLAVASPSSGWTLISALEAPIQLTDALGVCISASLAFSLCKQVGCFYLHFLQTVHSPLLSRTIVEIVRFALRAAILHECQNYLRGGGGLGGSVKNRGTVITLLQLAFRRSDRNFTPSTIH